MFALLLSSQVMLGPLRSVTAMQQILIMVGYVPGTSLVDAGTREMLKKMWSLNVLLYTCFEM